MPMLPTHCVKIAVAGLLALSASWSAAQQSFTQAESGLEPEFRQLRSKFSAMPEFSGTDAGAKFRLAEELAHRGDVQGAVESYRAAIHLKPEWPDPYRGLGQVLLDHHDYAEAVQALQTSIRLGRDDYQAFYWLGRAYMGTYALPAAAVALVRATELKPDDAEAFADLGLVRMAQGEVAAADQALKRSIQLKPDYAEAHRLLEVLTRHGRDPAAVTQEAHVILHELFGRE